MPGSTTGMRNAGRWLRAAVMAGALPAAMSMDASPLLPQEADTLAQIHISLADRRLWVLGPTGDTLFSAPAAVGSGRTLRSQGRTWKFDTPRGWTTVTALEVEPLWIPPDWHYVERARQLGLRIAKIDYGSRTRLQDGQLLVVQGGFVGLLGADSVFRALPADEEVIFDGTLFMPPFGTENRRVRGTLGPFRLVLANGIGLHGTPDQASIGRAVTHGCIRLYDTDVAWLHANIPVGARVRIY